MLMQRGLDWNGNDQSRCALWPFCKGATKAVDLPPGAENKPEKLSLGGEEVIDCLGTMLFPG